MGLTEAAFREIEFAILFLTAIAVENDQDVLERFLLENCLDIIGFHES